MLANTKLTSVVNKDAASLIVLDSNPYVNASRS